jgi:hypothetical protein
MKDVPTDFDAPGVVEDDGDLFYNLKTDESIPLIAEIRTGSSTVPIVHYDKFEIFDDPFLTSSPSSYDPLPLDHQSIDFTMHFPFRKGCADPGIWHFLFLFAVKGLVIDCVHYHLPLDEDRSRFFNAESWFLWGHPPVGDSYQASHGWGSNFKDSMKNFSIQIYG